MDESREHACRPISVPASLSACLARYEWARDKVGQSGGAVYRLHGKLGFPDLFLKHGVNCFAADLTDEMVRLDWLSRHVPVPAVEHFVAIPGEAWLLMNAMPGRTAYQTFLESPDDNGAIVDALARFLQRFHAIPPEDCPFNSDHRHRLARARERIDAELVDEADFDEEREGWNAERVWDAAQELLPLESDRVVTHGDFSLDNIMILDGEVVGCIDVGRVGLADRYQDLAILWNSLGEFEPGLQDRLLARYGIGEPNERKLLFHLLLDELF